MTATYTADADLLLAAVKAEMPELFDLGDYCFEEVGAGLVLLFECCETGACFPWGIALNGLVQVTDQEADYAEAFGAEWAADCGYCFG